MVESILVHTQPEFHTQPTHALAEPEGRASDVDSTVVLFPTFETRPVEFLDRESLALPGSLRLPHTGPDEAQLLYKWQKTILTINPHHQSSPSRRAGILTTHPHHGEGTVLYRASV